MLISSLILSFTAQHTHTPTEDWTFPFQSLSSVSQALGKLPVHCSSGHALLSLYNINTLAYFNSFAGEVG